MIQTVLSAGEFGMNCDLYGIMIYPAQDRNNSIIWENHSSLNLAIQNLPATVTSAISKSTLVSFLLLNAQCSREVLT